MKNLLLALTLGACLTGSALAQTASGTSTPSGSPPPHHDGPPGGGHGMGGLTPEEHQKLHAAQQAAFAANPDLKDEQEALQKKIDAATLKADPSVAPILAKIDAFRKAHQGGPGGPSPEGKAKPGK